MSAVTPYAAAENIGSAAEQMGRWLDRVLGSDYRRFRPREAWTPSINLYEDPKSLFLVVELAGVEPSSIDLNVEEGRLVLRGERQAPRPAKRKDCSSVGTLRLHLMEIDHGAFLRTLDLPASIDPAGIEACYRNGMLCVKMPKKT
jgi:HSP20 family protein